MLSEQDKSSQQEQEKQLSPHEVEIGAMELTNLLKEKLEYSENVEFGKPIIPTGYFSNDFQKGWSVNLLRKDKLKIQRRTEINSLGAGLMEYQKSEIVTISTGNVPSVEYDFASRDVMGKDPSLNDSGHFKNTKLAIELSKKMIMDIPQIGIKPKSIYPIKA